MNFLITAIGSFAAECTLDSLKKNFEGKFFGCDIYPKDWHHLSQKFDDVFLSPPVENENGFDEFISSVCERYDIKVIIPLTDPEVDFFNKRRSFFERKKIIVTIGDSEFLSVARDKRKLVQFTQGRGYPTIKTFSLEELDSAVFPLIGKPSNGRSSEGIFYLNSKKDLKEKFDYKDYIFQEVLSGKICTVDFVRNPSNGKSFSIPRIEHLRTKNGAGLTIEVIKSTDIEFLSAKIGKDLNIKGCVNLEFIINKGNYFLMDINPRFSAGIGFSVMAGFDFVKNHVNVFLDEDIEGTTEYKTFIAQKIMTEVINKIT